MKTDQIDPRNVMMRLGVKKLGIFPHLLHPKKNAGHAESGGFHTSKIGRAAQAVAVNSL